MSQNVADLLYLFDRPSEPIFLPRGEDQTVFEVPPSYLVNDHKLLLNFKSLGSTESSHRGRKIHVEEIVVPELGIAGELGRHENFSVFSPWHQKMAGHLICLLDGAKTYSNFLSACVYYHDRANPQLYIYCISVAFLHRPDTQKLILPPLVENFPEKFLMGSVFSRAREEANIIPSGSRRAISMTLQTASDLDPEHRLAYFREDVGINLHHWHWHLVYPTTGPLHIVDKDRRGELFFYMHSQIIARYNIERFCNNLGRVARWNRWYDPIAEAYFPKLHTSLSGNHIPGRQGNSLLKDINRPMEKHHFDVQDLEIWRDRILNVIATRSYTNSEDDTIHLKEKDGIDVLGNIIEATILSPNADLYGNLHNSMHTALSFVHDPDGRYLEPAGVIGDTTTAMRDPIFYRLHAWIEHVFQLYKHTLPAYGVEKLENPGIAVTGVEVQMVAKNQPKNVLNTFWQQSDVDLSEGLDFTPRGAVCIRFTHLQYAPYSYEIQVNNETGSKQFGTCRIFMAPKCNEIGKSLEFADQKNMMIELDKFTVTLQPGKNTIERSAASSSVTIPFERTFGTGNTKKPSNPAQEDFNFCGCGWPQHMLLPKGTKIGYDVVVFAMISNYVDDKIEQDLKGKCTDGASFCGIRNKKYPDARSMGYPFDRKPRDGVNVLSEFLTPNMKTVDVKIFHKDNILSKPTMAFL